MAIAPLIDFSPSRINVPDNFQRLVANSRAELNYADKCLGSYKEIYWSTNQKKCSPPTLANAKELIEKYRGIIAVSTYGEMWALEEMPAKISIRELYFIISTALMR